VSWRKRFEKTNPICAGLNGATFCLKGSYGNMLTYGQRINKANLSLGEQSQITPKGVEKSDIRWRKPESGCFY
jgi:hypothetical protein